MENVNYSKNVKSAKEILKKLLNERLEKRLTNLEITNEHEMLSLSNLSSTSNNIISNLNQYLTKIENTKEIKIPKLKLGELNKTTYINNSHNRKTSKIDDNNNSNEFDGILKNTNFKNQRNRERPISAIFNVDTSKTKFCFYQKDSDKNFNFDDIFDLSDKKKSFMTYRATKKKEDKVNKTFVKFDINNTNNNNKKKKKTKIKNIKCLTDRTNKDEKNNLPSILNSDKKLCKKMKITNSNDNNKLLLKTPKTAKKETRIKKKINKTIGNFYSNKKKENENQSKILRAKTPDRLKVDKEIKKQEKNLKSLCESMLVDVNKDELLVNDNKILFSGNIQELLNKNENKNPQKFEINFKKCIQYILEFLTIGEIFEFCRTKKEYLKLIFNSLINKTEKSIENINSILKSHNSNNKKEIIISKKQKLFELSLNSQKALVLLNSISKNNFIKSIKSFNNNNISKNRDLRKIILIL